MKPPNLPYDNLRELSSKLKNVYFPDFHCLPFNRFADSAIDTFERWWVSPTPKAIAFPYGKITLTTRETWVLEDHIFVGFNVEKGICDPVVRGDAYVIKDFWFWNEFLGLANEPLRTKIDVAKGCLGNMEIVVGSAVEVTGRSPPAASDFVRFSCADELSLVDSEINDGILRDISSVRTYSELASQFSKLNSKGFYWVDVFIGAHFTRDLAGRDDLAACAHGLSAFRNWMRGAR